MKSPEQIGQELAALVAALPAAQHTAGTVIALLHQHYEAAALDAAAGGEFSVWLEQVEAAYKLADGPPLREDAPETPKGGALTRQELAAMLARPPPSLPPGLTPDEQALLLQGWADLRYLLDDYEPGMVAFMSQNAEYTATGFFTRGELAEQLRTADPQKTVVTRGALANGEPPGQLRVVLWTGERFGAFRFAPEDAP